MNDQYRWVEFANEDLILAEAAFEKGIYNQVCFHSHQGVEKILKGFLSGRQRTIPKIHSLSEPLRICMRFDKSFSVFIPFVKIKLTKPAYAQHCSLQPLRPLTRR